MVDIVISETCRAAGRNQDWYKFKDDVVLHAEDIQEAHEVLKRFLNHIYNVKRRKLVYQDTYSKGTLHTGYIYSGMEGTSYLQAWCSFYDHKTRLPINPRTGAKYYTDEEATQLKN